MTESMIEKAGDAVLAALSSFNDPDLSSALGYIMQEPLDARALELRRVIGQAAIEAMREPTELMREEGFLASPHDVGGCRDQIESDDEWMADAVVGPYRAMIEAALKWPAGSADEAGVPLARD